MLSAALLIEAGDVKSAASRIVQARHVGLVSSPNWEERVQFQLLEQLVGDLPDSRQAALTP
jgi:hypothetical protein